MSTKSIPSYNPFWFSIGVSFKMNRLLISLLALLSGCSTYQHPKPSQFYEGNPLPIEQVARIRVPNVRLWVLAVDGKSTRDALGNPYDKSEVLVLPGTHRLSLLYIQGNRLAEGELDFSAEPGHMYTAKYRDVGYDKVQFYIKDQGLDYDERCLSLKDRPNVMTVIANNVPTDCY